MGIRRPFLKYFGSKWKAVRQGWYPAPEHDLIIEPFAGGAAYALQHAERSVLLVDLNPDVVAAWSYLIHAHPDHVRTLPTELEEGYDLRQLDIPYGAQVLIRMWQRVGRNDCWTASRWNNTPGQWGRDVATALAEQVHLIRHWRVQHGHYSQIPNQDATWFCDPPYHGPSGLHYSPGCTSREIDYPHLAGWLHSRAGLTICCEAGGADWLPFQYVGEIQQGRVVDGTRPTKPESVWVQRGSLLCPS